MALLNDRNEIDTDSYSYRMNETATRGVIVCLATGGSGVAFGDTDNTVTVKALASGGAPVGILLTDVVNIDTTLYHVNQHKEEVQKGNKVTIGKKGWWVTNNVLNTPSPGDLAYLDNSGNMSTTNGGTVQNPLLGRFATKKNQNGYARVDINLP
jgi:hypothetical protein